MKWIKVSHLYIWKYSNSFRERLIGASWANICININLHFSVPYQFSLYIMIVLASLQQPAVVLGIVFPNLLLPPKPSKRNTTDSCTHSFFPFLTWCKGKGEENWMPKRWRSWVEIRAIYWKQQWGKKMSSKSSNISYKSVLERGKWFPWKHPLQSTTWPPPPCPTPKRALTAVALSFGVLLSAAVTETKKKKNLQSCYPENRLTMTFRLIILMEVLSLS